MCSLSLPLFLSFFMFLIFLIWDCIHCSVAIFSLHLIMCLKGFSFSTCEFLLCSFFKEVFILVLERGEGKERETSMCGYQGPGSQPRHVPRLGIEPVTLGFAGPCSIHEPHQLGLLCSFQLLDWIPLCRCIIIYNSFKFWLIFRLRHKT